MRREYTKPAFFIKRHGQRAVAGAGLQNAVLAGMGSYQTLYHRPAVALPLIRRFGGDVFDFQDAVFVRYHAFAFDPAVIQPIQKAAGQSLSRFSAGSSGRHCFFNILFSDEHEKGSVFGFICSAKKGTDSPLFYASSGATEISSSSASTSALPAPSSAEKQIDSSAPTCFASRWAMGFRLLLAILSALVAIRV